MTAKLSHIYLRRRMWVARLTVPPDVQDIIGKTILSKSTRETSEARAGVKADIIVAGWKRQIEEARKVLRSAPVAGLAQNEMDYLQRAWRDQEFDLVEDAMRVLLPEGLTDAQMIKAWRRRQGPGYDPGMPSYLDAMAAAVPAIDAALNQISETRTPFLKYNKEWSASLNTTKGRQRDQYGRDLEVFDPGQNVFLEDITRRSVQNWISRRVDQGDASNTIQRRLSAIRRYWIWLQDHDYLDAEHNPWTDAKVPKTTSAEPRKAFTTAQINRLWQGASDDKDLAALIALAAYTGGRIGELCSIEVAHVDQEQGTLRVVDSKTDAGNRTIPVHKDIQPLLASLVKGAQSGRWLIHSAAVNQYGERSVPLGKRFGRLKKAQGHGPALVFHSIRKTVATQLQDAGCPEPIAADIIGHEIKTMTYGLYSTGSSIATRREWLEKAVIPLVMTIERDGGD